MNRKPLVEVAGLVKQFTVGGGLFRQDQTLLRAVDGVSFNIYPGETLGLVGESGCGKTTVGRCVLRLMEPTEGSICFDGQDICSLRGKELRILRREMQIIFQDPYSSLNPRMNVGTIVGEALYAHGLARGFEIERHVSSILDRVGLAASYRTRYPHEFSGGQRQRIGIARALALQPRFIVCDEAVSALDVSIQAQILNLLNDLQAEYGIAYLFISHDLNVIEYGSDRVAVMYLGKLVEVGSADDLFRAPLHPYTQALMSANPIPDPEGQTERIVLQGEVPSPLKPPSGCPFHPRCPQALDRCSSEVPPMLTTDDLNGEHRVRCHLYADSKREIPKKD